MATNENTATTVELPKALIKTALIAAAKASLRQANVQTIKYGPDHIMVQTLNDEHNTYMNAANKL